MALSSGNDIPAQIAKAALKELIDTKHLYQFLHIDFTNAVSTRAAEESAYSRRNNQKGATTKDIIPRLCKEMAGRPWWLGHLPSGASVKGDTILVSMPPFATFCDRCKDVEAFGLKVPDAFIVSYDGLSPGEQVFCFELLCQRCRGFVVIFTVKKTGDKLQIVGRSEFEGVTFPEGIPKAQQKFYSQAVIAYQAGHFMAAICVLRVVVEQHMRSVVEDSKKMKADEVCDAYMDTLPPDFKSRWPSFKDIYGKLSEAVHSANTSDKLFETQRADIDKHFKALKMYNLHQSLIPGTAPVEE
jgi:hypothetical protein